MDGPDLSPYFPRPRRRVPARRSGARRSAVPVTGFRTRRLTPSVVALCATLATAGFVLLVPPGPARADGNPCNPPGPLALQVTGPNGHSTTEPPGEAVTVSLVDASGAAVVPQRCSDAVALEASWSTSPDDHQGLIHVVSDVPASVTYTVTLVWHVWYPYTYDYDCGGPFTPATCSRTDWRDGGTQSFGNPLSVTITYRDTDPLVAAFSVPATASLGHPVSVDGTADSTDAQASVSSWSWDFGDGGHATGVSASHLYTTSGTYTITHSIGDSLGRTASVTHGVTIAAPAQGGGPSQPPAGVPPTASWTSSPAAPVAGSGVQFDGTGSSDSDGTITGYSWNFGGGPADTSANPVHTFPHAGDYPVTLTVTDDSGKTGASTTVVHVGRAKPSPAFTATPQTLTAGGSTTFDGTGSTDLDGTVQQYAWDFGDGTSAAGPTVSHAYSRAGSYDVTLTITDDAGGNASVTHPVTVTRSAPTAGMVMPSAPVAGSVAAFDGGPSSDVDGSMTAYSWDFGDGAGAPGPTPTHTYAHAGSYGVTLTVTDDDGLHGTMSRSLTVAPAAPSAVFTAPAATAGRGGGLDGAPPGTGGRVGTFDGTPSSDPDGSVTAYHWDFGDGSTAEGAAPAHTYGA